MVHRGRRRRQQRCGGREGCWRNDLKDFVLLKQPRLSVVPVPDLIWDTICHLGGGYHGDGNPEPNPTERIQSSITTTILINQLTNIF
jgi:hypothetical protein